MCFEVITASNGFYEKASYYNNYYPFYTQDMIVEVPDEVADLLREYKLAEAAYILRTYRHSIFSKTFFRRRSPRWIPSCTELTPEPSLFAISGRWGGAVTGSLRR